MDTDFSATTGAKGAVSTPTRDTPFDQIARLEEQENARVAKEIEAMEEEKREVEQALKEKEEIGDQEIKDAARKELMEYRETELSTIVKSAEKDAEKKAEQIEAHFVSQEDAVAKKLVEQALAANSPLLRS
ncbi:hypothetical protein COU78_00135 [Candidatus Peregrinibacteria bacterium CG10_big_fil_rev_8_21_14_0_10_49_24]|nr:MAG: hypothetical protein COV83_06180 [Candidatus Peregrinibacteria bacterium CG11_big_fil_rev_8_21_14_0_20_49_14]PIR51597.1 MAG: hypothetical protein COU78_00135 [Candidatus Peregrinibacteria bacterium CG10_big_fil_rev_8_21_14_0_10_49_24]PJA68042.1 MAG: hypothetical protein CO157_01825 [Candidatus Peregrinibacteria bacterium CG_4_9_14_3_um_filter_49_12]